MPYLLTMKALQLTKRLLGGIIILVGLVWFASLLTNWETVRESLRFLKLGLLVYISIGLGCIVTGALILCLRRQRLMATSLGIALVWSLVAMPWLVCVTHARTYAEVVSKVPQSSVRVKLSRTYWLLQRLRAGDTNAAIVVMENELDDDIFQLERVPVAERVTETVRMLERVRAYQAAHAPPEGQASVEFYSNQVALVNSRGVSKEVSPKG